MPKVLHQTLPHCIVVCLLWGASYDICSNSICGFDVSSAIYIIFNWRVNSSTKRHLICCIVDTSRRIYTFCRARLLAITPRTHFDGQFHYIILYVYIWLRPHCYTTAIAGNEWLRWLIIHSLCIWAVELLYQQQSIGCCTCGQYILKY